MIRETKTWENIVWWKIRPEWNFISFRITFIRMARNCHTHRIPPLFGKGKKIKKFEISKFTDLIKEFFVRKKTQKKPIFWETNLPRSLLFKKNPVPPVAYFFWGEKKNAIGFLPKKGGNMRNVCANMRGNGEKKRKNAVMRKYTIDRWISPKLPRENFMDLTKGNSPLLFRAPSFRPKGGGTMRGGWYVW